MKEKLNELRKNMLIEVSNWNGLGEPYKKNVIITKNKKMYTYETYLRKVPDALKKYFDGNESFYETKISDKDYEMVENFIKEKIISKKFEMKHVRDAGNTISGNLNYNFLVINNDKLFTEINNLFMKFYKKNLNN